MTNEKNKTEISRIHFVDSGCGYEFPGIRNRIHLFSEDDDYDGSTRYSNYGFGYVPLDLADKNGKKSEEKCFAVYEVYDWRNGFDPDYIGHQRHAESWLRYVFLESEDEVKSHCRDLTVKKKEERVKELKEYTGLELIVEPDGEDE